MKRKDLPKPGDARGDAPTGPFWDPGNCLGCGGGWSDGPYRLGPGHEGYYRGHPNEEGDDNGHAPVPRRMPRSISGKY
jgi:hypothetical protein